MIVTRSWLEEFVDLNDITLDNILSALNSIGLEVDSVKSINIPKKVVVGKVIKKEPHPDADKLSVCEVDLGVSVRQIVCGARNVEAGQIVPVAIIGAKLSEDFEIKPVKLRGVQSDGMICSSLEIGLPQLNDGIMVLDDSIGELELGKELNQYPMLNDDIIEIELTANRGDALSIYGVARDLAVKLHRNFSFKGNFKDNNKSGIGRFFNLSYSPKVQTKLAYKLVNFKDNSTNLLVDLRLSFLSLKSDNVYKNIISYLTWTTGVIYRAYEYDLLFDAAKELATLRVEQDEDGCDVVYDYQKNPLVKLGIMTNKQITTSKEAKMVFEVSFVNADLISKVVHQNSLKTDEEFYRSSRGSNSDLRFGIDYLGWFLLKYYDVDVYSGMSEYSKNEENKRVYISLEKIKQLIGQKIDANSVVYILQNLGFKLDLNIETGEASVSIPEFRQDINNIADITEEILRIIGIDSIESTPLTIKESNKQNNYLTIYRFGKALRQKAIANGFYESISYVFASKESLKKYGFELLDDNKELLNPITSELDTLRSTMLTNLLEAIKNNKNQGFKKIELFEIGSVYNSKREERQEVVFISSGFKEDDGVKNHGKPDLIDFDYFGTKLGRVIGQFELEELDSIPNALVHPYQSAKIIQNSTTIGYISKLHTVVQNDYDILDTFFAVIDFDKILPKQKTAKPILKHQSTTKDITISIENSITYHQIKKFIDRKKYKNIISFYPIDTYIKNKEITNLTIRFVVQSPDKTLSEDEISIIMENIADELRQEFEK